MESLGRIRTGSSFPKKINTAARREGLVERSCVHIWTYLVRCLLDSQVEVSTWSDGDLCPDLRREVRAGGLNLVIIKILGGNHSDQNERPKINPQEREHLGVTLMQKIRMSKTLAVERR